MLEPHQRCQPKHRQCSWHHSQLVGGYLDERQRQTLKAEAESNGYATELATYLEAHPLITFKHWLIGSRTR